MKRRIQIIPEMTMVQAFDEAGTVVLFTEASFPGMVGETYDVYKAYKVHMRKNKPVVGRELSYEDLKKIYRGVEGFHPRMDFWAAMRPMSPKEVLRRQEEEAQDARNRVR